METSADPGARALDVGTIPDQRVRWTGDRKPKPRNKIKTTIGMESSADLSAHSIGCADDELWLWGPQTNSYGQKQWGINEGRYGSAYSVRSFYTRKEAVAELRKMRRERAANEAIFELSQGHNLRIWPFTN